MFDPFGLYAWMEFDADARASANGVLLTVLCVLALSCGKWLLRRARALAGRTLARFRAWRTPELTDFDEAVLAAMEVPFALDEAGTSLHFERIQVWIPSLKAKLGSFDVRVGEKSCLDELSTAGRNAIQQKAESWRDMIQQGNKALVRLDLLDQLTKPAEKKAVVPEMRDLLAKIAHNTGPDKTPPKKVDR